MTLERRILRFRPFVHFYRGVSVVGGKFKCQIS